MRTNVLGEVNGVKDYLLANVLRKIVNTVDGQLSFGDNVQGKIMRGVFFHLANFNLPIDHELGRLTFDFIVLNQNTYGNFKLGTAQHTQNRIFLQCDTPSTTADILILG